MRRRDAWSLVCGHARGAAQLFALLTVYIYMYVTWHTRIWYVYAWEAAQLFALVARMCTCTWLCAYVYTWIFMRGGSGFCIRGWIYIHVKIFAQVYWHVHAWGAVQHLCVYIRVCPCLRMFICMCMYVYVHIHACIHVIFGIRCALCAASAGCTCTYTHTWDKAYMSKACT
jgi:hypothetical protein